ncbi:MAG: YaiI/YqxD family protein [Legionellales bacterium]|nr:YaiI/YqxD family protein [Legionellales bacterium]
MKIWIDADACPKVIKEILFRAAKRTQIAVIVVANQLIAIPSNPFVTRKLVQAGFDKADDLIIQQVDSGDLVITADIPLADAVIAKGAMALNPRGKFYDKNNIKRHLSIRNNNEELRNAGMLTSGPAPLSNKEIQAFANCLDKLISTHCHK